MTDREKAVVMAYRGIAMLCGDKFNIFHRYIEKLMGRPVFTHELPRLADEIKEKSKADFLSLCKDEIQTADVEEVVRCKECLYATYLHDNSTNEIHIFRCEANRHKINDENSFCSWGERKCGARGE